MSTSVAWALIVIGLVGIVVRSIHFVRVTIPANYGSNPGFGAYESSCMPWMLIAVAGVGVMHSPRSAAVAFLLGLVGLAVLGQVIGRTGRTGNPGK